MLQCRNKFILPMLQLYSPVSSTQTNKNKASFIGLKGEDMGEKEDALYQNYRFEC
jgi:hypothetical protein